MQQRSYLKHARLNVIANFCWFIRMIDGCRWTQAASGAAGRANVGLCAASSLLVYLFVYVMYIFYVCMLFICLFIC